MSLGSSIRVFRQILCEDAQLARLGAPRGTLLRLHYRGRWDARRGVQSKSRHLHFDQYGRHINLELSAPYEGAFKGVFLDQEYDCSKLLDILPKRVLDLGANIGMGAINLAAQFPNAELICVEPDPRNFPMLERNLRVNRVSSAVVAAAVGASPGTLKLRFGDNPTCSALESSPMHDLSNITEVKVTTVTELLANAGWDCVDLVKIDIEGTEDELLSQNNHWLQRVSAVILEIHPNTTPEKIGGYLRPFGFSLRRVGHGREPVYFAVKSL